jgi:hypothetical protein
MKRNDNRAMSRSQALGFEATQHSPPKGSADHFRSQMRMMDKKRKGKERARSQEVEMEVVKDHQW